MLTPHRVAVIENDIALVHNAITTPGAPGFAVILGASLIANHAHTLADEARRLQEENARLHETLASWENDPDQFTPDKAPESDEDDAGLVDTDLEPADDKEGEAPVQRPYRLRITTANPDRIRVLDLKRREVWRYDRERGHFVRDREFGLVASVSEAHDFYESRACRQSIGHAG